MPVHDAYARITPFELLLPTEDFADKRFPEIAEEAEEREADLSDPERFALLSQAGAVIRTIRGPDDDPRLIHQLGILLFHGFHFWKQGLPFFHAETGVMRYLTETGPREGDWAPSLPGASGYVQFPQHLFWVPGQGEEPAESLDGFFWSNPDGENLSVLIAMGIRKDRPGLSVIPLPSLPLASAADWASLQVRPTGKDFHSSLPGAELESLYSVEAGAEAIKLVMRVFWYLDVFPGSLVAGGTAPAEGDGPQPSRLDSRRIVLRTD